MAKGSGIEAVIAGVAAIAAVGVGGYFLYNYLSKPPGCTPKCGDDGFKYICQNGALVKTSEPCVNPCDLVGPCVPNVHCDDQNNLYAISCNPANGNCDLLTLRQTNAPICISHAPAYMSILYNNSDISEIEASNFRNSWDTALFSPRSAIVEFDIELLDAVMRPVPNAMITATQTPNDVGGFVVPGTKGDYHAVECRSTTLFTDASGKAHVKWVCIVDQGAGAVKQLTWNFQVGTLSRNILFTHHSLGYTDPVVIFFGQPCYTREGRCLFGQPSPNAQCWSSFDCNYVVRPVI